LKALATPDLKSLLVSARSIAELAAQVISKYYLDDNARVSEKLDLSPVTDADFAAHKMIVEQLKKLTPELCIISEEDSEAQNDQLKLMTDDSFWLVDPLDGTKEFIQRNGEFTVNIALIHRRNPVLGVVLHPTTQRIFSGIPGFGAWLQTSATGPETPITARDVDQHSPVALISRSHRSTEEMKLQKALPGIRFIQRGSSLKFCELASGQADIYFRMSPTKEWDTAAGHAVLIAAGGKLIGLDGKGFAYNKPDLLNSGFLATGQWSDRDLAGLLKVLTC
jgi:3'(2'), 5'-bisphosphate nucleotidase